MPSSRKPPRRALVALNVVSWSLAAVLAVVVAGNLVGGDEQAPAPEPATEVAPGPTAEPEPVRRTIRTRSPVGRYERARCRERPHRVASPTRWFHPREYFYPPGADAPSQADLDHLLTSDDAVVVRYRRNAPAAAQRALERWAAEGIGVVVAPTRARGAPPLEAFTATRRLTCDGVDLDRLTIFTDRHFSRPLRYQKHPDRSGGGPRDGAAERDSSSVGEAAQPIRRAPPGAPVLRRG